MRLIHACIVVPFMAYKGGDGKGRSYKISMKHNNNMKHNDKRRSRIRGGNMRNMRDQEEEEWGKLRKRTHRIPHGIARTHTYNTNRTQRTQRTEHTQDSLTHMHTYT